MKKTLALLLTIIIALLTLAGCGAGSDAPEGMQTVRGSDALGYYFYATVIRNNAVFASHDQLIGIFFN